MISYATFPLLSPPDDLLAWCAAVPEPQAAQIWGERQWPGRNLDQLPFVPPPPPRGLRLNRLHWPRGASRWATFCGLVDGATLEAIRAACNPPAGYRAQTLTIADGTGNTVSTDLWMLPARPLAQIAGASDLYLIPLVDERYFWWHRAAAVVCTGGTTTWTQLYTAIANALGITLTVDTIPAAHVKPASALTARYEALPILLDAVAYSVQQRIVRQLDGTVRAWNADAAHAREAMSLQSPPAKLAGGLLAVGGTRADNAPQLPTSVVVAFPKFEDGVPSPDKYLVETALSALSLAEVPATARTHTGKKYIRDTCGAVYIAAVLQNGTELGDLATQIASDWYRWQCGRLDVRLVGSPAWVFSGLEDFGEWSHGADGFGLRLARGPVDDDAEDTLHYGATGGEGGDVIDCPVVFGGDTYFISNAVNFYSVTIEISETSIVNIYETTINIDNSVTINVDNTTINIDLTTINVDNTTINIDVTIINIDNTTIDIDLTTITITNTTINVDTDITVNVAATYILYFDGSVSFTDIIIPILIPGTPRDGNMYYDPGNNRLRIYEGPDWIDFYSGPAPPDKSIQFNDGGPFGGFGKWDKTAVSLQLDTGGNTRGNNAVDLQTIRTAATQVASGTGSIILCGTGNTASAAYSCAGGATCTASGLYSLALVYQAQASANYAVAIGEGASATAASAVAIGHNATSGVADGIAIGGSGMKLGVLGATPVARPTVSGDRGGSDALGDLLDELELVGYITDSTTDSGGSKVGVRKNSGGSTYQRRRINLIEGTNITLTLADDGANEEVDVTIDAASGSGTPAWTKVTKTYSDLSTASTINDIEVYSAPAGSVLHAAKLKHTAAFTGGTLASYNVGLGYTGNLGFYIPTLDVYAAPSNTGYATYSGTDFYDHGSATSVRLNAASMGGNLDQATAGSVDIWLLVSTPP